jgi:phosphopantetheinyl transferase (holo-ACP synthase)
MSIIPIEQFKEVSIRVAPGEYVTFPVIDNKGLFMNHKRCKSDGGYLLETVILDEVEYYGIYKCDRGIAFLTAAFSSKESISKSVAMIVLKSFPYVFADLKTNLRNIFPELKISLHMELVEPYYNTVYVSIENELIQFAKIKDPRNLTFSELNILSVIPELAEKIVKIHG